MMKMAINGEVWWFWGQIFELKKHENSTMDIMFSTVFRGISMDPRRVPVATVLLLTRPGVVRAWTPSPHSQIPNVRPQVRIYGPWCNAPVWAYTENSYPNLGILCMEFATNQRFGGAVRNATSLVPQRMSSIILAITCSENFNAWPCVDSHERVDRDNNTTPAM